MNFTVAHHDSKKLFFYDPSSKSCLPWAVDRGSGGTGAKAGSEAGTLNVDRRNGYAAWLVKVEGRKIGAHRIVTLTQFLVPI